MADGVGETNARRGVIALTPIAHVIPTRMGTS